MFRPGSEAGLRPAPGLRSVHDADKTGNGCGGGAYWERTMQEARIQAETYARALPPWEGWPPFLIVVDVGHSIELFADFSLSGTRYSHFPDQSSSRILLEDLVRPKIRTLPRQGLDDADRSRPRAAARPRHLPFASPRRKTAFETRNDARCRQPARLMAGAGAHRR